PAKQACPDFVTIDLVEHFVSSTGVEIVGDVVDAHCVIAVYQEPDFFELLAHWVFAARKQVDGQVVACLAKTDRVGQPGCSSQNRCKERGLKLREAQWVVDEYIDQLRCRGSTNRTVSSPARRERSGCSSPLAPSSPDVRVR